VKIQFDAVIHVDVDIDEDVFEARFGKDVNELASDMDYSIGLSDEHCTTSGATVKTEWRDTINEKVLNGS
jgi:hypothetical protein